MPLASLLVLAIKASIFLQVFSLGLAASPADAAYLVRRPAALVRALIAMNVLMPLVAVALVGLCSFRPEVELALIALALSPLPPILPKKALRAGGRTDYTVALLATTAVVSIVWIPLVLALLAQIAGRPGELTTAALGKVVLTTVLVPLALGIAARAVRPSLAERVRRFASPAASVLLIAGATLIVLFSGKAILALLGDGSVLAFALFGVIGTLGGHLLGGPESANRTVLALATASRHPGVAVAIAHAGFPEQKQAVPAVLLCLIVNAIVSALYLAWRKRRRSAEDAPVGRRAGV